MTRDYGQEDLDAMMAHDNEQEIIRDLIAALKQARYKILVACRPLKSAKDAFGLVVTELKAEGLITEGEWKELML